MVNATPNATADIINTTANASAEVINAAVNASAEVIDAAADAAANGAANIVDTAANNASIAKEAASGVGYFFKDLFLPRFMEILKAPVAHKEMLWMVVPLVVAMLLMMLYFSRYKKEELGWNTAVGNSLILIFIGIDLLRRLVGFGVFKLENITSLASNIKLLVAIVILAEGVLLLLTDFSHLFPKKFAFFISSPIYINLTAYMGLVIVYSNVPIDIITLLAAAIMFLLLSVLFFLLSKIVPESAEEISEGLKEIKETISGEGKKEGKKSKSGSKGWVEIKAPKAEKKEKPARGSTEEGILSQIKREKEGK